MASSQGVQLHQPHRPPSPKLVNEGIREYVHTAQYGVTNGSQAWRLKSEIPSSDEIMGVDVSCAGDEMQLAPNVVDGPWPSKDAYLKSHYELLREDAVAPLRDAVAYVRNDRQMMDSRDMSVYEKVHIIGATLSRKGVGFRVQFSTRRAGKEIDWEFSKRLLAGSIVALSPVGDCFKSKCVVATVAARPVDAVTKEPPEIDIFFSQPENAEFDPQKEWIMVEPRHGYYEASRYTMAALQRMPRESFPLADHISSLDPNVDAPQYIKDQPRLDLQLAADPKSAGPAGLVNVLGAWPAEPMGTLDTSQWAALKQILTKKLAVVQGPPGTGKTYVSVTALRILLAHKSDDDPPIIIAAQTNHALDQLLTHISPFEGDYVRLGGRSSDPDVKKRTLHAVRQREPVGPTKRGLNGPSDHTFKRLGFEMTQLLKPFGRESGGTIFPASFFVQYGVLTKGQSESLEDGAKAWIQAGADDAVDAMAIWLGDQTTKFEVKYVKENFRFVEDDIDPEYEQLKELEAEQGIGEDDHEALTGTYLPIKEEIYGQEHVSIKKATVRGYVKCHDLWKVPLKARGAVYNAFRNAAKERIAEEMRRILMEYNRNCVNIQIGKWEQYYFTLEKANVIGMTTTGLSKYRGLVSTLKPKVVLIEEAAEVLEAPISAACFNSLEHLILIGDHMQLKGSCSVKDLTGDPFHLDMSMFERFIRNETSYVKLCRQRRMAPEIRKLLEPVYGELQDHPSVLQRPGIPGMGDLKSYFFTHDWPERDDSLSSKVNEKEAQMVAGFYVYLAMNNIPAQDITILTFYNGQRKHMLKLLRSHPYTRGLYIKVITVDSYQGEENEVVILSLVRSGRGRKIGFLSIENRACVSLSRAKRGFYIFGNAKCLEAADPLWANVVSIMKSKSPETRLGDHLPLTCTQHEKRTLIEGPEELGELAGGCEKKCHQTLDCGHTCPIPCHGFSHSQVSCFQRCRTRLPCGHDCVERCSDGHTCVCRCPVGAPERQSKIQHQDSKAPSTDDNAKSSESRHAEMITAYRNFANGGAKEHDERLLAKAQSLMQEDDPDVPDLLDFNDAPSRGDHGGVPDEGACVSSQTPASQSSLLD